jgi:hypothetical protein
MPAVFAIEMMAEAATLLFPGLHVWSITGLRALAVKVRKDRPTTLKVGAVGRLGEREDERAVRVRVTSDFIGPDGRILVADRLHYTCEVQLRSAKPVAEHREAQVQPGVDPAITIPPLYGHGGALPHGPAFQVVERVHALDSRGVIASLSEPDARSVLPALNGGGLLTLPFARGAFQAAGLWAILRHGHLGLPRVCGRCAPSDRPTGRRSSHAWRWAVDPARIEFDIVVGRCGLRQDGDAINPIEAAAASRIARTEGFALNLRTRT